LTPPGAAGKPILSRALQLSESALAQGRGALTTLRVATFSQQDLLRSLKLAVTHLPGDKHRAIRYSTDGEEVQLRAGMGEEIVQILREALRNALQHTHGRIDVRLSYTLGGFLAIIKDEGLGISPTTLESGVPGRFGLTGMRERAARITASLTIESSREGTQVRLLVPGRMAYVDHKGDIGIWARLKSGWSRLNRKP
jgi:signal transduction histidine kinase